MLSSNTSAVSGDANYIEDVFSTYLYTGTGSSLPIVNNIDLSTKGGLVWTKIRSAANDHILIDTVRGTSAGYITTDAAYAQTGSTYGLTAFNTDGYTLGNFGAAINQSPYTYASWTFRKQPKFFDIQTYTGSASAVTINHNLGSSPGCVIIKCTDTARNWMVWHRSLTNSQYMYLNTTDAVGSLSNWISVSSTQITIQPNASGNPDANYVGRNYIAYVFAHDAGGFGLTGTDNVISCGSVTTNGSGDATINLGYEPQWVIVRRTDSAGQWFMLDSMRDLTVTSSTALLANNSGAEGAGYNWTLTSTGFKFNAYTASATFIYIAIRRGPMKVPTDGTTVFKTSAYAGGATVTDVGFPPDLVIQKSKNSISAGTNPEAATWVDRLRGAPASFIPTLFSNQTAAETTSSALVGNFYGGQTQYTSYAGSSYQDIGWAFKRAPSFFDEVCYTGTGTASQAQTHNLGVAPELIIIKKRSGVDSWFVGSGFGASTYTRLLLDATNSGASITYNSGATDLGAQPTSTNFYLGTDTRANGSGSTYVAYLFATCAGVSKCGNYTGTGTTKQVDCGFAAGARFVLIKRTDSTGAWYVWDTTRGIVSGNDPYLLLNTTAAQVTTTDYIDPYSSGFELSSTAPAALNASGGTYIFLAIA